MFFFLFLCFFVSIQSLDYTLDQLLPPATNPLFCRHKFPKNHSKLNHTSWICDPDEILNEVAYDWFDTFGENIPPEDKIYTLASCWIEGLVLPENMGMSEAYSYFAHGLIEHWNVGQPQEKGSGIMIFVAFKKIKIVVDWGIKHLFPRSVIEPIEISAQEFINDGDEVGALFYATEQIFLSRA